MANRDLVGMLTGINSAQRPNPNASSDDWRMQFGEQQAQNLNVATGKPTPEQAIQMGMGKLNLNTVDGLKTMAQMQQLRGDMAGAAKTASMIQAMRQAPLDAAEKKRIDERDYDLRKREVEVKERSPDIKNPALIQEYNFAKNEGYEGTFMEFVAAKKSPLVSTQNTPQQQRDTQRIAAQSKLYERTQEQIPAAQKNLGTAKGILGIVSSGEATGQAGATVASFATSIQSTLEVLGIAVPEEIATKSGTLAQMKRYAGEALMPFIEQQGRGFTDTEREYFLKNVIAGYDQPWQFNDAYGTVLLSKSLSEIEQNNFAYAVSISDDLLDKPPQNLWSDYERKVPRLKVGTKTRGGKSYEGAIVIQDNENLSQYWTKESPKGFKVANGENPPIEYAWEDLEKTAKYRNQTVRELLVDFSRGGDLIGGIY